MKLDTFDYALPEELIANRPLPERTEARLLVDDGKTFVHAQVRQLQQFLRAGDVLVFNDTRVIPARLQAKKPSGGAVEVLLVRSLGDARFVAMMRNAKNAPAGTRLVVADDLSVIVERADGGGFFQVHLQCTDVWTALDRHGHIPLPPYIRRADDAADRSSYQTLFADKPGSAAAPTAGLHFTESLLTALADAGVERAGLTLHVGPGTFLPVREEAEDDIRRHTMHAEVFELPEATVQAIARARARGGRVVAVGTTSARTLESAALWTRRDQSWGRIDGIALGAAAAGITPMRGESELYITPGYAFSLVDVLMTNFHLPRSTLLMLVSAFVGLERCRMLYKTALSERYRFFSYGDTSLLTRGV